MLWFTIKSLERLHKIKVNKVSKETKMTFMDEARYSDRERKPYETYDQCIDRAKSARNTQRNDTNPMMEKEGFLGMDELDRMRRRNIR